MTFILNVHLMNGHLCATTSPLRDGHIGNWIIMTTSDNKIEQRSEFRDFVPKSIAENGSFYVDLSCTQNTGVY